MAIMSPVDTVPAPLWARDIVSDLKDATSTFSSWDSCMSKAYCKWPVIAAIIIGALIVLSIVACVVNCLCCGIQCCKCCLCCSSCCPSPRNRQRKTKHLDDPYPPPDMPGSMPGAMPGSMPPPMPVKSPYQPPQAPPVYRGTEVARFDAPTSPAGLKYNEDALPAMPSWDTAVTKRVEDTGPHVETVELETMHHIGREPRRMPSAPRMNGGAGGGGYMGPPPVRTGTPGQYPVRTGTPGQYPARTGTPGQYPARTGTPGQNFDRGTPGHYPEPQGYNAQPSYGYDGPETYGYNHHGPRSPPPISPYDEQPYHHDFPPEERYQAMSPAPTYTTQPAYGNVEHQHPHYTPSDTPLPPYMPMDRTRSPGPALSSAMNAPRPVPYRQPSPAISQYTAYPGASPVTPTSPPSFAAMPAPHESSDPGRPPSLLQSGRRPVPNSYRDV
ncbi:uncharacterized protein BP01DRAFT_169014 [Aspergillus saccharolyticus JOP 1030-1]|uniref:Fibroin-3 related protein n=1 Tax=Aspergillus saccharolyticus JOP 1030-1 TaxID=1450539 RepID=A0A319A1P8_9EURO|nr:hypothetical protein BP01DRAFT_169014 [Aspergillus saccharolyticus JOP 1030-1]PYH41442.1 hypothetical protein BP01DRAFT_169014 [Aspergillus saccharolyticus JOP 1030-1]